MRREVKNSTKYIFGHRIEVHATPKQKRLIRLNYQGKVDAYNMTIHYLDTYYKAYLDGLIDKAPDKSELSRFMTAERAIGKPSNKNEQPKYPYSYYSRFCSATIHKAVEDCFKALETFFKNIKTGKTPGYPKRKCSVKQGNVSCCVAYGSGANKIKITQGGWGIKLPAKIGGEYRLKEQPRFKGIIKEVHLQIELDRVFVSIKTGANDLPRDMPDGKCRLAFDLGMKKTTIYDGVSFTDWGKMRDEMTAHHRKVVAEERLKQSRMTGPYNVKTRKKQKPSRAWFIQEHLIKSILRNHKNRLSDLRHRHTTKLIEATAPADKGGFIVTQKDNLKSMHKRKKAKDGSNARLIQTSLTASRMGWGEDRSQLAYKAKLYGRDYEELPQNTLTTGICPCCGHVHKKEDKHISKKMIVCRKCKKRYDRNKAASYNMFQIKKRKKT